MLERAFQSRLIKKIKEENPGCIVIKTDPNYRQGLPDLLVLCGNRWGALEVKRDAGSSHQPNQDWYVEKMNAMSFARFIYPENERKTLDELRETFRSGGDTCVSESEQ